MRLLSIFRSPESTYYWTTLRHTETPPEDAVEVERWVLTIHTREWNTLWAHRPKLAHDLPLPPKGTTLVVETAAVCVCGCQVRPVLYLLDVQDRENLKGHKYDFGCGGVENVSFTTDKLRSLVSDDKKTSAVMWVGWEISALRRVLRRIILSTYHEEGKTPPSTLRGGSNGIERIALTLSGQLRFRLREWPEDTHGPGRYPKILRRIADSACKEIDPRVREVRDRPPTSRQHIVWEVQY